MSSARKKGKLVAQETYRKAIADLADCEERYQGLLEAVPAAGDARLEAALAALQSEVDARDRAA
jgi:hypothetical protein